MKKNNIKNAIASITLFSLILFSSCDLNEVPVTFRTSNNYYKNASECEVAVDGAYTITQNIYSNNFFELVEFPSDYTRFIKLAAQQNIDLVFFHWNDNHAFIAGFYSDAYGAINRFNSTITKIDSTTFLADSVKHRMIGEVKFLRGLHYFNLVRVFGEMPVSLTETTDSKQTSFPKWSNEDIFKKVIIPDLSYAEKFLPLDAYGANRASGIAAKALLAKVYLWLESCGKNGVLYHDWVAQQNLVTEYTDSVKMKCTEIMRNPKYGLYNHYYDLWLVQNKLSNSGIVEHLFAVNFQYDNSEGNRYASFFNAYSGGDGWDLTPGRDPVQLGKGQNVMAPTLEFWNEIHINPNDKRDTTMFTLRGTADVTVKDAFIAAGGSINPANTTGGACNFNTGQNFGIVKYRFSSGLNTTTKGSAQMPVLRYADVLLMYAEACGYGDQSGLDALNRVRRRAYEKPTYSAVFSDFVDNTDYTNSILEERKIELCFEIDRWFDLVRTHKLKEVMTTTIKTMTSAGNSGYAVYKMADYFDDENKRMFFPLPATALQLNKGLEQNAPW